MVKKIKVHGRQHAERGNSYTQPSAPANKQSQPKPPKPKKK